MARVAVIGAGWAGLSAAVRLKQAGHDCTVFEAARTLGGRARRVDWSEPDGSTLAIDNGQHILLGAYRETLDLMQALGIDPAKVLQRLPLSLESVDGFRLRAPAWPAPFHLIGAILTARGLPWSDRFSMLRFMTAMRRSQWRLVTDLPLSALLDLHRQSAHMRRLVWEPLCVAALNTPAGLASSQVFLNVLRDSLGGARTASDLLLPGVDLGSLLPDAAEHFLGAGCILRGERITRLALPAHSQDLPSQALQFSGIVIEHGSAATCSRFDGAILAVAAPHAAPLLRALPGGAALAARCEQLRHQSITTVYLRYPASVRLAAPMLALREEPASKWYGQWAFDRGALTGVAGLIAVVISADGAHRQLDSCELGLATLQQLARQAGLPLQGIGAEIKTRVVIEKRATFSCEPDLDRPDENTPHPCLFLAGDYTAGDYPATLESAVASGKRAAHALAERL